MRDLSDKRASYRLVLRITLFFFLALGLFPFSGHAQAYLDIPIQFDYYRTNTNELNFSRRGVIVNPTIGFTLTTFDSTKFELSNGFGVYYSKFNQEAGNESFHYQRVGILQYNLQCYYDLPANFRIGAGASVGVYANIFGKIFKVNLEDGSEKEDRLGEGLRNYNVGNFLEIRYWLAPELSVGSKFTYWYIPQLKYRTIGDFGEFSDYRTDLFTSRLEFSVRIEVNR